MAGLRAKGQGRVADMISGMTLDSGHGIDFNALGRTLLLLVGVYALSALFAWLQQYLMAGIAQRTIYRLRRQAKEKLTRLPVNFFDLHQHGDILSRVTNDIDNISHSLQQSLTQLITSVLTIVGVVIMMLTISPLLTLISAGRSRCPSVITMRIAKRSQKQFAAQWERTGDLNGHVEEMYTGPPHRQGVRPRSRAAIDTFDEKNDELYQASWKAQFITGIIMPVMNFVMNLDYVAVGVIGGIMVASGRISLGDVQAFIQYSRQFTMPITQVASIVNVLQSHGRLGRARVRAPRRAEETPDAAACVECDHTHGHISFDDVSFRYVPDTPLISRTSRSTSRPARPWPSWAPPAPARPRWSTCCCASTTSTTARISVDGVDIRHFARSDLRRLFGMVLQDTWLFSGTIRENIAYGREGATEEEIRAAAKAARVDHFMRALPDGYDTVLDDDATNVSQGERQLLTIARAFLADPDILILDEATSTVDTRTEVLIQQAMAELMKGRTSFVIAHRLSHHPRRRHHPRHGQGRDHRAGHPRRALAARGFYYDLYDSQFEGALDEAS